MAKPTTYKTTAIASASGSKNRSARATQNKKASREAAIFLKQVLAVRCPTCGAAPGEECKLAVGSPRTKPHRDRRWTAKD